MRDESRAQDVCAGNVPVPHVLLGLMNASSIDIDTPNQWARMLQTLLSHLDGMVYRCRDDDQWTMEFVSQGCLRLTGYRPEQLLFNSAVSYQEITHPEDRERVDGAVREALAARKNYVVEYRIVRADGAVRWVSERGVGVYADDGTLLALEGIVFDVTERKEAEIASRETERRYKSLFDNALEGIFRTTVDGRYMDANPALARIYGYDSPQELIEKLSDIRTQLYVEPGRRERFMEEVQRTGTVSNFESQVYRKDGAIIWISETARVITDEEGNVVGYEGMVEDISEHKQREQELIAAREAAEAANRAKSQFLANMSHEIRTPLNGVIGMIDLLLDTPLDRTQLEYAQTIRSSAQSLLTIINDLLDFSKIEAGKMELESTEFRVHDVLEDVATMMAAAASAKGLELIVHVAPHTPAEVRGDPQRLKQCLINLVGNAVKFSERGEILIGVEPTVDQSGERTLHFSVKDEGVGIDPQCQARLFEPFVQADSSVTRRFGGTGLGLSIVRALVSMMGGRIGVESQVGKGSCFWFDLPCEIVTESPEAKACAGQRVLVVDKSEAQRAALAARLQGVGCEVGHASTVAEALQRMADSAAAKMPYRIVLTGLELRESVRLVEALASYGAESSPRVVLLTAIDRHAKLQRIEGLGFAGYLSKPVRTRDLVACISGRSPRESVAVDSSSQAEAAQTDAAADRIKRVLVVEDNLVNQKIARRFLERLGCEVTLASNGREGVAKFKGGRYDLVLMDLQMPVMGGLEAVQLIRALEGNRPRTPVIALTAHAMSVEMERCLDAGMDDFLTKPLLFERLQQAVEKHLPLSPVSGATQGTAAAG